MRGPQVRFCERRGGVILRAYSTRSPTGDARTETTGENPFEGSDRHVIATGRRRGWSLYRRDPPHCLAAMSPIIR
jgi:hypothetical protein